MQGLLTVARQQDKDEGWLLAKGGGANVDSVDQGVLHRAVATLVPGDLRNGLPNVCDAHLGTLIQQVDDEVLQAQTECIWYAVIQSSLY